MNRFLATTALVMFMGARRALAQSPDTPSSPPQDPGTQAPMQPEILRRQSHPSRT